MGREHYIGRRVRDGPGCTVEVCIINEPEEKETVFVSVRPPGEVGTQQGRHLQEK